MTKGFGTGATALKNAFRGRTHKERGQVKSRRSLGILEKKKDYQHRARGFKRKRTVIRKLRESARQRNPDEFNTAMTRVQVDEFGRHVKKAEPKKGKELRKEAQSDLRYLRYKASLDAGAIKQMRRDLSFAAVGAQNQHTVFVEDPQEAEEFDAVEYFDTVPELVADPALRARRGRLARMEVAPPRAENVKQTVKQYHDLAERVRRKQKLDTLIEAVEDKQKLLKKGRRRLVSRREHGEGKTQFKWDYERQR